MLYQPSFPQPYSSDIDATIANNFTSYINAEGGTQVIAYNLNINDLSGNSIYTTNKTTLTTPLYGENTLSVSIPNTSGMVNGNNYVWNITMYEANPTIWVTSGTIQATSTTTNIYISPSYLIKVGQYIKIGATYSQITSYDNSTGLAVVSTAFSSAPTVGTTYSIYSDNVTSFDYYFQARTTPTLTINNLVSTMISKSYTFNATYTQVENVGWKYFEWTLYDVNAVVLDTSGQITSGQITYTADGFISGTSYGISLTLENQDGVVISLPISYFTVQYSAPSVTNVPTINLLCEKDAIGITWDKILTNTGVAEGSGTAPYYTLVADQPYSGGSSVQINSGADIYWYVGSSSQPVDIPYNSTTYFYWTTDNASFNGVIMKEEGVYVTLIAVSLGAPLTCSTGDKYYDITDDLIYTAVSTNTWGSVGVAPDASILYTNTQDGNTYFYNGTTMIISNLTAPYYTISFVNGDNPYFSYIIFNGSTSITGIVYLNTVTVNLFQASAGSAYNNNYVWVDTETWSDTNYWVESYTITDYWYKITMLPTGIQIYKILQ